MPSQMSAEQTDRFGDVLSQGFDKFVCNDGPSPPTPSTARDAARAVERRRGSAEHCSAPPQPARDAARAVGWVGGREGEFAEHAPRPSSDSGVQAGMRPAREGNGHDFHDRGAWKSHDRSLRRCVNVGWSALSGAIFSTKCKLVMVIPSRS
jgi:hypothetical protein